MQPLNVAATEQTPKVTLNKSTGVFEISGRSLPENAPLFYKPILGWLHEYATSPNATTTFSFKLEYINTSSSKIVLELLGILQRVDGAKVIWYFQDEDEDMEETGEEFSELVSVPFEFKPI
jgi:hypothetical protein